ncbi:MAG: hypothetical protein OXU20_17980 [Myxococcales bacterium]|nr:hypothetical protein [Myxococcales bacterium]MDD9971128.1 hypothetical protein [Myxococcales bacterium]
MRTSGWYGQLFGLAAVLGCPWGLLGSVAAAQTAASTEILAEPTSYTDVLDAFEPADPFDIRISWGYEASTTRGTVQRELATGAGDGRAGSRYVDIADSEYATKRLTLDVEVGVFRDLMVFFQLPFVLEHDRSLHLPGEAAKDGSLQREQIDAALLEPLPTDGHPEIFRLRNGVASQPRDGIPSVSFGLAWSVFNQYRSRNVPTWTLRFASEVGTGAIMLPCVLNDEPDPSEMELDSDDSTCPRGVSQGTIRTEFGSRWSYRYRVVEPYLGVEYVHSFVGAAGDTFRPTGDLEGDVDSDPPSEMTFTSGVAVIPWENRSRFQRLSVDARFSATYVSAGRDYSPLFDALGASQNEYLTSLNRTQPGDQGEDVRFTGLTRVEDHARIGARLTLLIQAARYVRFQLGTGIAYAAPHLLTGASPCNLDVEAAEGDPRRGTCLQGISNPSYRAVIDEPGKRFRLDGALTLDISAAASGQF